MKVCVDCRLGKLHELIPRPFDVIFDEAKNAEPPIFDLDIGRFTVCEDGKLGSGNLSRG